MRFALPEYMAVARRGLMLVFALVPLSARVRRTTSGEDGGADGTVKDVFVEGPAPCVTSAYAVDAIGSRPRKPAPTPALRG